MTRYPQHGEPGFQDPRFMSEAELSEFYAYFYTEPPEDDFDETAGRPDKFNMKPLPRDYAPGSPAWYDMTGAPYDPYFPPWWHNNPDAELIKCAICGCSASEAHNGEPVVDGRVCTPCNHEIIVRRRLDRINAGLSPYHKAH